MTQQLTPYLSHNYIQQSITQRTTKRTNKITTIRQGIVESLNTGPLVNSPSNHSKNSTQLMQTMSNQKKPNSTPMITPKTKQIEIETNNNKISNTNYNVEYFTAEGDAASIGDSVPLLAIGYNDTNNIDNDNDCNDNKRGKTMPELLKYPRYNDNAASNNNDDSENKDTECPVLINRCDGDSDSDDEKEENKVDQTPMAAIKKSINMISGFLNRRKHSIFQDNIDEDNHTDDKSNIDKTS